MRSAAYGILSTPPRVLPCLGFDFAWFVGLLTDLFRCRAYITLHQRIASAFSPSHDSPSNDRFSPHAGFPAWKQSFRNTATFGILPHVCNRKCANCKGYDRFFPCPGFSPDSLVQRTSTRVQTAMPAMRMPRLLLSGSRMCHKSHGM